jgi:hypothetical protein
MVYDFIKLDGMLNEFKIYKPKIDFEKMFNELTHDIKKDILDLTVLYYNFFIDELSIENVNIITISLNSVKKIDKIPVRSNISVTKNFQFFNTLTGYQSHTTKISINICLPSYEYVENCGMYEILQSLYLINCNLQDEHEFKKYLYNILFYAYILFTDFQYHPMLKYLNYKDDIDTLLKIKYSFIRLYGELNECSVCLENTITSTICGHPLCQKCYSQLQDKVCPSCRNELIDETIFRYDDISIDDF